MFFEHVISVETIELERFLACFEEVAGNATPARHFETENVRIRAVVWSTHGSTVE